MLWPHSQAPFPDFQYCILECEKYWEVWDDTTKTAIGLHHIHLRGLEVLG